MYFARQTSKPDYGTS